MNILPALQHHLRQHTWIAVTHNNHPSIQTTIHHNKTTIHIQIIQNDNTLQIEHTVHHNFSNYTKKHTVISLLDQQFLDKIHQAIESTP